jgi:hypothetical protein
MTNPVEIAIPTPHAGQKHVLDHATRFTVLACGRRWGKTRLALIRASVALSEKKSVAYFSPTYKNISEMWRDITRIFAPALTNVNKAERRFELVGGGSMEMWSLDHPGAIRGRKYALALIDEAAHVIDLEEAWNAVIRPTLTDLKGDAWFLSTPAGHNHFFELYNRGANLDFPDWTSFHAPSKNNPVLDPDEIEAAKLDLPQDIFQQEYEAKFRTAGTAVFRNIGACLNAKPSTPEDHEGHQIIAGIDWGQQNDFTAISLACRQCRQEVHLDRFNQIGWSFQRGRIESLFDKWNVRESLVEMNSIGSPNFEGLLQAGLSVRPFHTTAQSKPQLIQNLALGLEREELQFINDPIAVRELEAYRSSQSRETGRWSFGAPPGLHDDTVIARALMFKQLNQGIGVYV